LLLLLLLLMLLSQVPRKARLMRMVPLREAERTQKDIVLRFFLLFFFLGGVVRFNGVA
jgi:hypothetical protein